MNERIFVEYIEDSVDMVSMEDAKEINELLAENNEENVERLQEIFKDKEEFVCGVALLHAYRSAIDIDTIPIKVGFDPTSVDMVHVVLIHYEWEEGDEDRYEWQIFSAYLSRREAFEIKDFIEDDKSIREKALEYSPENIEAIQIVTLNLED